jgi:hypothetical protein
LRQESLHVSFTSSLKLFFLPLNSRESLPSPSAHNPGHTHGLLHVDTRRALAVRHATATAPSSVPSSNHLAYDDMGTDAPSGGLCRTGDGLEFGRTMAHVLPIEMCAGRCVGHRLRV